jgi:glycosyltransferase involved in cell wall biosynthesis
MSDKVPISVVLLVKNEEKYIQRTLESVKWAQDIIIADDKSTDKTVEIARKYTDRIYTKKMEIEGAHRNWAYSLAECDWILSLDGHEEVTKELADELARFVVEEKELIAGSIPIRIYIGRHWARYGGWYPANKVRLFKRGEFKYDEKANVHPRAFYRMPPRYLKGDIIHWGYENFEQVFNSINRQTTLEAKKMFESGKKFSAFTMCRKVIHRFFKSFILKGGIRGGVMGFMVGVFVAVYPLYSYLKLWELENERN